MNSSNHRILKAPIYHMASGTCSHLERELEWTTAPHMQGKISNMSKLDRRTMPYMGIELISLGNGVKQNIAILVISLGNGVGRFLSYAYRHNSCSNGVVGDLGIFANLPLNWFYLFIMLLYYWSFSWVAAVIWGFSFLGIGDWYLDIQIGLQMLSVGLTTDRHCDMCLVLCFCGYLNLLLCLECWILAITCWTCHVLCSLAPLLFSYVATFFWGSFCLEIAIGIVVFGASVS